MLSHVKDTHPYPADSAQLTQIPWLDWALRKNRLGDAFQRTFGVQPSLGILGLVGKAINEKQQTLSNGRCKDPGDKYGRGKDFLTRYIEIQQNDPEVPPW